VPIASCSPLPKSKAPPLLRQLIAVLFFRLLLNTGRRFVYPFAPVLSRSLEVPLAAITSILATCQIASLLGLFSGPLADRFGYRTMMRAGLGLLAGGMLLSGLAQGYWWLFLGLVVASLGKVVFDPAIQAYIGTHIPFERRGRVIGVLETAWAGSTLLGIPALGLIIEHFGLHSAFWIFALLGGISWLTIGRFIPEDAPVVAAGHNRLSLFAALPQLIGNRPCLGMLLFGFWISIANDSLFVVYGVWFEQAFFTGIAALGFSTVAIGAAELLGESMTAVFADRLGLKRAMILGLCLAILAYLALPFIGRSLPWAMVGLFFIFLSFEFTIVCSFSMSTELLPKNRATMMAGFYATAGLGRMVGVLLGGGLWQHGGIIGVAFSAAGLTALALLSLLWGLHGWQHQTTEEKPS